MVGWLDTNSGIVYNNLTETEEVMATKKLITTQFLVTLVEYIGPDAEASDAGDLEMLIADNLTTDGDGTCMVIQTSKSKVLVQGRD